MVYLQDTISDDYNIDNQNRDINCVKVLIRTRRVLVPFREDYCTYHRGSYSGPYPLTRFSVSRRPGTGRLLRGNEDPFGSSLLRLRNLVPTLRNTSLTHEISPTLPYVPYDLRSTWRLVHA